MTHLLRKIECFDEGLLSSRDEPLSSREWGVSMVLGMCAMVSMPQHAT